MEHTTVLHVLYNINVSFNNRMLDVFSDSLPLIY